MKPRDLVAFVDGGGFVRDAAVVSIISDGKAPLNALTLRTLDDDAEHSNVQHAEDRPASTDERVVKGHISAGHWRAATETEATLFAQHATRRAKAAYALALVNETPREGETPAETKARVDAERTAIIVAAAEPPFVVDVTPWVGETAAQTELRVAAAQAALQERH
jgi:hypothetical protein